MIFEPQCLARQSRRARSVPESHRKANHGTGKPSDDWEEADDKPAEIKFIGWPAKPPSPPDPLEVEILKENQGATDAADQPCPEYEVKLLRGWTNHRSGEPVPVAAGDTKTLTCGPMILKDRIEQLQPVEVGDQLRIVFDRMAGRAKHFQVGIKRKR